MQLPTRTTQSDCGFLIMLYLVICKKISKAQSWINPYFPIGSNLPESSVFRKDAKQNLEYQTLQMKKHYYKRNHIYLCLDLHKGYIRKPKDHKHHLFYKNAFCHHTYQSSLNFYRYD